MSPTAAAIIAAIFFGLGGGAFVWFGRLAEKRGKASLSWPTVPGRILRSELKRGSKGSTLPDISYSYTVAGKDHTGTAAKFSGTTNAADSKRLVEKYPVGAHVAVAYDPADPSSAVLEVGASRTRGMIIFGIVMLIAAVGSLGFALLQPRP